MKNQRLGPMTLVVLSVMSCAQEIPEAEPVVRPVRYQRIDEASTQQRHTFVGVARAGIESRLSFRVSGTVEEVRAEAGDRVRQGQVLARLDPTDYELRVEEAEAAVAQGIAASRRAQADYDRTRALYENNNAAKSELDAGRANAESAEAQVEAGQKQLEQAQQQVGYTRLRAPLAGAVAQVQVEVNENVQAGQSLFLLTSGAHPEVRVAVPEVLISSVERVLPAVVRFDAFAQDFDGTVTEVAGAAGDAPTFAVTVRINSPTDKIRSGMAADVEFLLTDAGDVQQAIFLPLVAVGEDHQGNFVYVIEPGQGDLGTARRRAVEVGKPDVGVIRVESGVSRGELVATAGVRRLVDGMTVRLLEPENGAEGTT